jgi:Na+/H+-dicarboxylate symporter
LALEFTAAQELFILIFAIHFTLIIERVHSTYNPYDTYSAWKGVPHAIKRLVVSWVILYILPLLHFAIFFVIIGTYNINFDMTLRGVFSIVLVGLLSFFDFGYYRIFEAALYYSPDTFFTKKEQEEILEKERGEVRAHLIPGICYVVATIMMLLILIAWNTI